jgi:hypothetical protein
MWWEIVGWLLQIGAAGCQMQTSPPAAAPSGFTDRTRTGSPSAEAPRQLGGLATGERRCRHGGAAILRTHERGASSGHSTWVNTLPAGWQR